MKAKTDFISITKSSFLKQRFLFIWNDLFKSISGAGHSSERLTEANSRIESVDFLRGLVMIIMALDHVRSYLHHDSFIVSPTNLQQTTPALFATRLITHLCAPAFILLAGTSAYFIKEKKSTKEASFFLFSRGIWLVILQLTIVRFGWNFDPAFHYNASAILSTIGFCMMGMALLIYLPLRINLIVGFIIVFAHNMLDKISFDNSPVMDVLWTFLHAHKIYDLGNNYTFLFLYPLIPWIGVMMLGYCLGALYNENVSSQERKKLLMKIGIASIFLFVILRWANIYGDPTPWVYDQQTKITVMSFLNIEKYPPSLLFLCLMLGIALIGLALLENLNLNRLKPVTIFGKVALFYYVIHIFVIHAFTLFAVVSLGYPWETMIFMGSHSEIPPVLKADFGFTLFQTYIIWISIVCLLYPFCSNWYSFKRKNKTKWWVSYV
jgi:uncharacterized membrane protein